MSGHITGLLCSHLLEVRQLVYSYIFFVAAMKIMRPNDVLEFCLHDSLFLGFLLVFSINK